MQIPFRSDKNKINAKFCALIQCSLILLLDIEVDDDQDELFQNIDSLYTPTCIRDNQVCYLNLFSIEYSKDNIKYFIFRILREKNID